MTATADLTITEPVAVGGHPNAAEGLGCGQECLRRELSLSWGDERIEGQCPVLHRLVIAASDDHRTTDAERAPDGILWAAIVRTLGTDERNATRARAYRCTDWAVREVAPVALDDIDLDIDAQRLRDLAPIVDETTAAAASTAASAAVVAVYAAVAARAAATAARAAGGAAARAAGGAAARSAGGAAATATATAYIVAAAAATYAAAAAAAAAAVTDITLTRPIDLLIEMTACLD